MVAVHNLAEGQILQSVAAPVRVRQVCREWGVETAAWALARQKAGACHSSVETAGGLPWTGLVALVAQPGLALVVAAQVPSSA